MRAFVEERPRLFLTFAEGDLALARDFVMDMRRAADVAYDYSLPSQPFTAQRADIIRASLTLRIQRCTATVCLFGAATLDSDWVLWSLAAARRLGRPLFGVPLLAGTPREAADRLSALGAVVVPAGGTAMVEHLPPGGQRPSPGPAAAGVLDQMLRLMLQRAR